MNTPGIPSGPLADWLQRKSWPLWLEHGIDWSRGGFHESLDPATLTCQADFRRLRVAARQTYVFARALAAGLPGAERAVELGLAFLLGTARQPDGGYAWRFSLDHRVIDDRRDLYDHAFVLLALATAWRVMPREAVRQAALALHDWIGRELAHPAGGFRESLPDALPRRQNPHMHLLEACLAAAEAFGDERFLERADGLVDLLLRHFIDPANGTLVEYLDEQLRPLAPDHRVEPGHHAEWIWLIDWYLRLRPGAASAQRLVATAVTLATFVARYGHAPGHDALLDEVGCDGVAAGPGARLWPQAEQLKAALISDGPAGYARAAAVLQAYLRPDGLWHERRLADGSLSPEAAPASSLYHLSCAILFTAGAASG